MTPKCGVSERRTPALKLNLATLIACGIGPTQARRFIGPISVYLPRFAINTPLRTAAFIAQCGYESDGFAKCEEDLYYRTATQIRKVWPDRFKSPEDAKAYIANPKELANRVYAGILGNGDTDSGDGWRFRGRGLMQITGRSNYLAMGEIAGRDWVAHPEELLIPPGAVVSACAFWSHAGCNAFADQNDCDGLTRRINGRAMRGALQRKRWFQRALEACSVVVA
jgi:putative chitinase